MKKKINDQKKSRWERLKGWMKEKGAGDTTRTRATESRLKTAGLTQRDTARLRRRRSE